jgi:hypothetical protein
LTGVGATNIINYPPPSTGQYRVGYYIRVVTATTLLTLTLTWDDESGAQSLTLMSTEPLAVGSYPSGAQDIHAVAGTNIVLQATASAANRIFISASLEKL